MVGQVIETQWLEGLSSQAHTEGCDVQRVISFSLKEQAWKVWSNSTMENPCSRVLWWCELCESLVGDDLQKKHLDMHYFPFKHFSSRWHCTKCRRCGTKFSNYRALRGHIKGTHFQKKFCCDLCHDVFDFHTLEVHRKCHQTRSVDDSDVSDHVICIDDEDEADCDSS